MPLTSVQLPTLKTAILNDPTMAALFNPTPPAVYSSDKGQAIADLFNLQAASPTFTVWKTNVDIGAVGDNIVATELAGLSSLNATRLQTIGLYSPNGVNPSLPDRRAFFDDVFSGAGGIATRAKLLILWKRLATRAEKLFATGTGTDAVPAVMTFEGDVVYQDVDRAKALP